MSKLWVVIPAAGHSRRYAEYGAKHPKPLLTVDFFGRTQTMIEYVLDSIPEEYLVRERCIIGFPIVTDVNLTIYTVVYATPKISQRATTKFINFTRGQPDTVFQLIKDIPSEDSILTLDSDMLLRESDIRIVVESLKLYSLSVAVAKTFDPNASRVDQIPYPTQFVDKSPISAYGIVSARAFSSAGLLRWWLKSSLETSTGVEPNFAAAMNGYKFPAERNNAFAHLITDYVDWGTPERLLASGAKLV